jgi:hypothetical protein
MDNAQRGDALLMVNQTICGFFAFGFFEDVALAF